MWRITAGLVMIILLVLFGASAVFAQDVTPEPTADVLGEVVVDDVVTVADGGNNSPTWYLLALGVVVFFATFAQYNLERMSGKSMRELSNSVPTHVVTLLLNGGSYLAKLTTTDVDDKAFIETGKRMGYNPYRLADGSIFWGAPASPSAEDALREIIDPVVSQHVKVHLDEEERRYKEAKKASEGATPNG